MSSRDSVMKYMEIFYSGQELERLHDVLADDLEFRGPMFRFDSSRDYVDSLLSDPPVGCSFQLLYSFEQGDWVNLIYKFSKGDISTNMSQLFKIRDNRITDITLIFDTGPFQS